MSLQVWLPLNGDTHNQGLSNVAVTNNGAMVDNNGKIGKCYSFNNSAIGIGINNSITLGTTFSIACWIKINNYNQDWANAFKIYKDQYDYIGLCMNQANATTKQLGFHIYKNNGSNVRTSVSDGYYMPLVTGVWYHLSFVITPNTIITYQDGENIRIKNISTTFPSISNYNLSLGKSSLFGGLDCSINDFRLYNHALSPKEVEEIAKGLVLHYKLDDIYEESTINLSNKLSNTCYNGSTGKYNYGTSTDMYKTSGVFQGRYCEKVYMGTAGLQARPYIYINNMFVALDSSQPEYKTLSFDYYPTIGTYINPYKLGNGNSTASYSVINSNGTTTGTFTNSGNIPIKTNEWNHIELTMHATTQDSAQWGYIINGNAHTSSLDNYWLFANIQVEEKDHATGYTDNQRTSTTIYDSSGYSNDGTIVGSLTVAAGSLRYDVATVFNGTNSAIKVIDNNWCSQGMEAMTINVWVKSTNWPTNTRIFSCTESGGFNTEGGNSGYYRFPVNVYTNAEKTSHAYKYDGKELQISSLSTTDWIMLTFVYDLTGTKTYINGELHHTYTNVSYGIYFNLNARLFLGCEANTATPSTPYFNGQQSDFRIYTTALTAVQVKELYNTSMSVDSSSNLYSRELIER